eukprot:gb/GECH01001435.1/.p1 GENE.gb/GECH01001435.1/~~gb/GECH01001435.1/.p1  ORF type:complete len:168 (+),score=40.03 gb/GECH01001435.1/:1-504(+)
MVWVDVMDDLEPKYPAFSLAGISGIGAITDYRATKYLPFLFKRSIMALSFCTAGIMLTKKPKSENGLFLGLLTSGAFTYQCSRRALFNLRLPTFFGLFIGFESSLYYAVHLSRTYHANQIKKHPEIFGTNENENDSDEMEPVQRHQSKNITQAAEKHSVLGKEKEKK